MFGLFHSKNAQAAATWVSLLTAIFTGIGKLIPEWFGQFSWPQLILMAFGAALATLLILSLTAFFAGAGGALYRRFRPLPNVPGSALEQPELPLASDGRTLTERLNKMETTYRAIHEAWEKWQLRTGPEILGRLDHLTQRADKLDEELKNTLRPTLERLVKLAAIQDAQERLTILEAKLRDMQVHVLKPPSDVSFANGNTGKAAWLNFQNQIVITEQRFSEIRGLLDSLGFEKEGRKEAIAAAVADIRADAIHAVLKPDEVEKPWADGGQKRHWKMAVAAMEAQIGFYAKELERLRGQADWVRNARHA